jgi:hypothetical protein
MIGDLRALPTKYPSVFQNVLTCKQTRALTIYALHLHSYEVLTLIDDSAPICPVSGCLCLGSNGGLPSPLEEALCAGPAWRGCQLSKTPPPGRRLMNVKPMMFSGPCTCMSWIETNATTCPPFSMDLTPADVCVRGLHALHIHTTHRQSVKNAHRVHFVAGSTYARTRTAAASSACRCILGTKELILKSKHGILN